MTWRERWADLVVRGRWVIVVAWVAAAAAATAVWPTIEQAGSGALGDLVPDDAEALQAELRSAEIFGFPLQARTVVVQRDPDGLSRAARQRAVERAARLSLGRIERFQPSVRGAVPLVNVDADLAVFREEDTAALTYLFFDPEIGRTGQRGLARLLIEREMGPADAPVGVTGVFPARVAQTDAVRENLERVELLTLLLVTAVVGLHFRALLAPIVNLLTIGVTYFLIVRTIGAIGEATGVSVASEVEPVIVVLLFGVLTDYAVFFMSRLRSRLAAGESSVDAARATTADLIPTILTAGMTIAMASAALLVAELNFLRAFGPGLAMSGLAAMAAALTLLPALLAIAGPRLFWPSRPGPEVAAEAAGGEPTDPEHERPVRSRALRLAARRPWLTMAACTIALLALASGAIRLEVGQTLIRGLPSDAEAHRAYDAAAQAFAPGVLAPTALLVEQEGITERRAAHRRMQERLEALPGVLAVVGPSANPLDVEIGATRARNGNAVRYLIVFEGDPYGALAIRHARTLRAFIPDVLTAGRVPEARAAVVGDTALAEETVTASGEDVARVAPLTLIAVVLVLAVFLRAIVAPIYLVAASVLSVAAALGASVYLFQDILGYGELTFYVPFAAAVLLVALGSDYNVFLAGRIWPEAERRPLREAVEYAGSRAASAITVAGLVLAASFALLALVPVRPFRELAFIMSAGLLLDAFVVRTLLVPALIVVFGRR